MEAPVINGGRMEMGLGGGICEISSLLYNLCLQSGFTVLERSPHSLLVPYVPGGLDAAVSWGTMDFRFRNSYTVPVVLLAGYDEEEQIFMASERTPICTGIGADRRAQIPGESSDLAGYHADRAGGSWRKHLPWSG